MVTSTIAPTHPSILAGRAAALDATAREPSTSAVSWGAILAGAAAAAALSLLLLILGTGLGLSSVSPWAAAGVSAGAFGVSTIVWLTVTQLLSAGMGGYLAGRLRTKWVAVHTDEVYFRDTAHGFLAWAIASLATAALLGSVIAGIVNGGVQAGASIAGASATGVLAGGAAMANADGPKSDAGGATGYFVDSLFRKDMSGAATEPSADKPAGTGTAERQAASSSAEVTRIFLNSLRTGALPAADSHYVAQVVAQRTGLAPAEAEKRVNDAYANLQVKLKDTETSARAAADAARKAASAAALWLFISLLIGAFIASLSATFGGRQRDA